VLNTDSQDPAAAVVDRLRTDPAFMDVRVSDADPVAAGQELSQARRKLGVAMVTAYAGRALEQRAKDAVIS